MTQEHHQIYVSKNRALIRKFLIIWLVVSIGLSILLVEFLNVIKLGNVPLGFWIAQQGSILVFVILNFAYALQMDKLDFKYKRQNPDDKNDKANDLVG